MKNDQIVKLFDSIESTHTITCEKCGYNEETSDFEAYDAAEYFHSEGWAVYRSKTYCSGCLPIGAFKKKKLKRK